MSKRFLEKYGTPIISVGEKEITVNLILKRADLPNQDDLDGSWVTLFTSGYPVVQVRLNVQKRFTSVETGLKMTVLVATLPVLRSYVARNETSIVLKVGKLESDTIKLVIH